MRRTEVAMAIVFLFVFSFLVTASAEEDWTNAIGRFFACKPGTVRHIGESEPRPICRFIGTASAFDNGLILTNGHVVAAVKKDETYIGVAFDRRPHAVFDEKRFVRVSTLCSRKAYDYAWLKPQQPLPEGIKMLSFGTHSSSEIKVLGWPGGVLRFYQGKVVRTQTNGLLIEVQIGQEIIGGISGSPVVSPEGKVIGLWWGGFTGSTDASRFGMAIPASWIKPCP